jgi:hypothetical protein
MRSLAVALLLLLSPVAVLAAEVGSVAALRGDVRIVRQGDAQPARAGAVLMTGDRVVTGAGGMALLQLRGGLTLTVARDTELVVGNVVPSPAQATLAAWLDLIEGLVRAVLSAPGAASDVQVDSPLAVTSVRSTEWTVEHGDDHTAVFCRDGEVAVAAAGATVTLAAGDGTDVRGDAPPTEPVAWGEPRVADTLARSSLATP